MIRVYMYSVRKALKQLTVVKLWRKISYLNYQSPVSTFNKNICVYCPITCAFRIGYTYKYPSIKSK